MYPSMSKLEVGKPHVAFYGFRSGPGGISHVIINLMHGMANEGVSVDLLLNNPDIPELKFLKSCVHVVPLAQVDGWRRIPSLIGYLQKANPDVLLVSREPANRAAVFARTWAGSSTRIAVRVGMAVSIALKRRSFFKRVLRQSAMNYCYHRADHIIANSRGVAEDITMVTGIPLEEITIINNPTVSSDMFSQAAAPVKHPWFQPSQPPVVLGAGRLARQKDFPTLLKAFAKLRSRKTCRLVIIGEGKERRNLEELATRLNIQKDTDFPGYQANPFAYMKRSAQFVLSSAWEGSPNVLIQALALGVPVVATDCRSGPRDILEGGRHGPLVPVGDVAALAQHMERTLDHPLDSHLLQRAADRFRVEHCIQDYMRAMEIDWYQKKE